MKTVKDAKSAQTSSRRLWGGAEELLREGRGSLLLPLNQEAAGDLRRSLHRHAGRERRGRRHGGGHPVRVRAARDHDRGDEGADAEGARRVQNDSSTDKALKVAELDEDISMSKYGNLIVHHFLFDLSLNLFNLSLIWLQSAPASLDLSSSWPQTAPAPLIWPQSGFNLPWRPSECPQSGFNLPRRPSI